LFDPPPYELLRTKVVREMSDPNRSHKQRDVAAAVGTSQPIVQKILKLERLMAEAGSNGPYEQLLEPPEEYRRLRRHKHPRYRFEPLPHFEDESQRDEDVATNEDESGGLEVA
jgi:hypothetical protein